VQTCGRAARNEQGRVIMYADKMTEAIRKTILITNQRRAIQEEYNRQHGITPRSTKREITYLVAPEAGGGAYPDSTEEVLRVAEEVHEYLTTAEIDRKVKEYEGEMKKAAKEMRFEDAANFRDLMRKYQKIELM